MKKYIDDFTVLSNERLNHEYVVLNLKHPSQLPHMLPGQFVEVKVENGPNTFLRRPISIHDIDPDQNTACAYQQTIKTTPLPSSALSDVISSLRPLVAAA